MKLRKVAVAIVGWVLLMSHAQPAGAHDWADVYQSYDIQGAPMGLFFYQTAGGLTHRNVVYAIGHMSFFGASASYPALQQGPARWNNVPTTSYRISYAGADNNIGFHGDKCAWANVWFFQAPAGNNLWQVDPSVAGEFRKCQNTTNPLQVNGGVVLFNTHPLVKVNGVVVPASWYTSTSGGPAEPWRIDLASISTHESGHIGGWTKHLGGAQCVGLTQPTMCETPTGGNVWWRSLESHDRQNVTGRYPTP